MYNIDRDKNILIIFESNIRARNDNSGIERLKPLKMASTCNAGQIKYRNRESWDVH
jgi:hypothetical protein